ncbi:MBL fold metallo-hydrolase [Aquamicrobium segne]|uniref:MBL fold metallo-hydrolase n=1 Tax=Aquamicrobium segne TaxID=469547 RepID=A0ABW0H0R3_9HYPH
MTLEVELAGGFGEKGRTSVVIGHGKNRVMLDAGIKVGASGRDYYPRPLTPIDQLDAVLISHAHEDHVGALNWLLSQGFRGRILMTRETRDEAPATLEAYAEKELLVAHPFPADRIELFQPGDVLDVAGFRIYTGRSGHVVGGVWFALEYGARRVVYCADVVPDSAVFVMDAMPECDLLLLDASYGADPISGSERAQHIKKWIAARAGGCLLPTPLSGRSLELIAAMPGHFAIHASMRQHLLAQTEAVDALKPGMPQLLRARIHAALDWTDGEKLPDCPLLADDGMGRAGPSSHLIPLADAQGFPILLSGHLPTGTPGYLLHEKGRADWIRMPTHPTLSGNLAIWEGCGRPPVLGHSCGPEEIARLGETIPALQSKRRVGERLLVE